MRLTAKTEEDFGAKSGSKSTRMANFRKVTQNPYFLKTCKGGTMRNFLKITQKNNLDLKAQKHSGENDIIL